MSHLCREEGEKGGGESFVIDFGAVIFFLAVRRILKLIFIQGGKIQRAVQARTTCSSRTSSRTTESISLMDALSKVRKLRVQGEFSLQVEYTSIWSIYRRSMYGRSIKASRRFRRTSSWAPSSHRRKQ
jgi:hypothetical protein